MSKVIMTGRLSMSKELVVALRSLIAHRRKTWAIVASVAMGICALVLVGGYYEYNFWGLKQALIRSQYAHLQLYQKGYLGERDVSPFTLPISDSSGLIERLEKKSSVITAAPRSRAMGMINGHPVEIWGVDPDREARIFTFTTAKRGVSLLSSDRTSCQISPRLASNIGVALNQSVTLMAIRQDGMVNALELKVQSLIGSYAEDFDQMVVIVPKDTFIDLFGTDMVHEVVVLLPDDTSLPAYRRMLQAELQKAGYDLDITIWYEQAMYFRQVVAYYQGFYRIVLAVTASIVFFAAGTTMSLSLLERTREFGTCLSMGTRRKTLVFRVFLEIFFAGSIGLVAGAVLSFLIAVIINVNGGIYMPTAPGMSTSITVYIRYSPQAAVLSLISALFVPLAAVCIPARRILSQSVVALLNKEIQ